MSPLGPALVTLGALAVGSLVRAHAQAPQPSFKAEVNLIEVDATVVDEDGNFVTGLRVDDFEVLEDGQPQKIQSFSHIDLPLTAPVRFLGVDSPVAPDVRSNREPTSGRIYLIVLDDLTIPAERSTVVREHAREFIASYVGAGDLAAVAYTSGRTNASQDFTPHTHLLLAAADKFMGRRGASAAIEASEKYYENLRTTSLDPPDGISKDQLPHHVAEQQNSRKRNLGAGPSVDIDDFEKAQRAITTLRTLRSLAQSLADVRGRRKALVLFSEGLTYQMNDPFGMRSVSDVLTAVRETLNGAARANVNFYTVDPRALVGVSSDYMSMKGVGIPEATNTQSTAGALEDELKVSRDSLWTLAHETGGFATINTNDFASAFERVVEANSQYYVLGYTPPDHPADGRFHTIEVRVKRPGVKVVARRGYASPGVRTLEQQKRDEAERIAREASRPNGDTTSPELRRALHGALQETGLTVSVHAAPFRGTDKDASVAVSIEVDGLALEMSPKAALELSFYAVSESGRAGAGVRKEISLGTNASTADRVKTNGLRLNPRIALPPGRHQLRVGVRETPKGQTGSLFYDLIVPDFAVELSLSGMLVTSASAQQTPTAEQDRIPKQLPGAATSRREFPVGDTLAVYAEMYAAPSSGTSHKVDIHVRLISEEGRDVFTAKDAMAVSPGKPAEIFAQFTLQDLDAGAYLLRIEAAPQTAGLTPLVRETLITVVP